MIDPYSLPDDLPAPADDGACEHLPDTPVPPIGLSATDGQTVSLAALPGRTVVFAYPRTGRPGERSLVADWDLIPGARGCTPESCAFRDLHGEFAAAGAAVLGLSTQDTGYQLELTERLHLPFAILSDANLELAGALGLPTFEVAGQALIKRLTLLIRDGVIERVWYPVFPPDRHAGQVLEYIASTARLG